MNALKVHEAELLMVRNTKMMKKVKPRKKAVIPTASPSPQESRFWGEGPILRKAKFNVGDPIKVRADKDLGIIIIERCEEEVSTHTVSKRIRKGMDVPEPVIDITNETVQIIPAGVSIDIFVYQGKLIIRKEVSFEIIEYSKSAFTSDSLQKIRLLSLFSGGGLGTASFVDTGLYESIGAIEWGEMPLRAFAANFPSSFLYWGGVEHISPDLIPQSDAMLITPPCQRFSKLGIGQAGLDNALSIHITRIVLKSNPQVLIFENVNEYFTSRAFEIIKELLVPFQYWVSFQLNPIEMGGIASRPRGYQVAFRERVPFRIPQYSKVRKKVKVADFLDEKQVVPWREKAGSTMAYFEGEHASKYAHTGFAKSTLTLVTPDANRVSCFAKEYYKISRTCSYLQHEKDPNLWRPFSVKEVSRMMNLPDWYEIPSDIPPSVAAQT